MTILVIKPRKKPKVRTLNLILFLFFKGIALLLIQLLLTVIVVVMIAHGLEEGKNIASAAFHFPSNQFLGGGIEDSTRNQYPSEEDKPEHNDEDDDGPEELDVHQIVKGMGHIVPHQARHKDDDDGTEDGSWNGVANLANLHVGQDKVKNGQANPNHQNHDGAIEVEQELYQTRGHIILPLQGCLVNPIGQG